ncbi:peptidoglycan-binding protein LysM [Croceiramulus getboli]|nr:peptidoglycan-binding protein LysM [Flavobacteriaceae bacterium YJPT1-3]
MVRNVIFFAVLPLTVVLFSIHSITKPKFNAAPYRTAGLALNYTAALPEELVAEPTYLYSIPYTGKTFIGFREALAFKESQGDYSRINEFGYMGKYQFGKSTLDLLGVKDADQFLQTPLLQERAFLANASRNKWVLRRDIKRFSGTYINGTLITESGILAAAHLAGPGSVKKYLRSGGVEGFEDAYGTSIQSYLKKFSGYDVSFIKPNKKARARIS